MVVVAVVDVVVLIVVFKVVVVVVAEVLIRVKYRVVLDIALIGREFVAKALGVVILLKSW